MNVINKQTLTAAAVTIGILWAWRKFSPTTSPL